MTASIAKGLEQARAELTRVAPLELAAVQAAGGFVVDVRPEARRSAEGHIPAQS